LESPILTPIQRKSALVRLGKLIKHPDDELTGLIQTSQNSNGWFTAEQTANAIAALSDMLNESSLDKWFGQIQNYPSGRSNKKVGLILAGNIPMVGFHDILCVLSAGHTAMIKLSSQDQKLIPYLLKKLTIIEPGFSGRFHFIDRLGESDAVIATGSNNSSRYFEYYFGKLPHIIRKNRNSIAVLSGKETSGQLHDLGYDIFSYFGLGCRNVSKLFVPEKYNFDHFFESIQNFASVGNHHKYNNNYDYNKSIYLVNRVPHLDNGFLLLKQDEQTASPLAVLYYEEYSNQRFLEEKLNSIYEQIQCVVTGFPLNLPVQQVAFGESQHPELWDYADGIDTMQFLLSL
jgi:hypothetical protein